jgi:hypothetical protein
LLRWWYAACLWRKRYMWNYNDSNDIGNLHIFSFRITSLKIELIYQKKKRQAKHSIVKKKINSEWVREVGKNLLPIMVRCILSNVGYHEHGSDKNNLTCRVDVVARENSKRKSLNLWMCDEEKDNSEMKEKKERKKMIEYIYCVPALFVILYVCKLSANDRFSLWYTFIGAGWLPKSFMLFFFWTKKKSKSFFFTFLMRMKKIPWRVNIIAT